MRANYSYVRRWKFFSLSSDVAQVLFISLILCLFAISIFLSLLISNPVPAIRSNVTASYIEEGENKKKIDLVTLDNGRFRVAVKDFIGVLHLNFKISENEPDANLLMIRKGYDPFGGKTVGRFLISLNSKETFEIQGPTSAYSPRQLFPLHKGNFKDLILTIESLDADKSNSQLIIDEVGIYAKHPNHFQISENFYLKTAVKILRIVVSFLGLFLIASLPKKKAVLYGIIYVFVLGFATFCSIVYVKFSPEWTRDLKLSFASGSLQSGVDHNYHYGLYMATSILEGKGPLIDGMPPWCRMPGYGFLLSMVKSGSSYTIENLLQAAVKGVWLHIFLIISSLTFFFWAACRMISPLAAAAAVTGILLLPVNIVFLMIIESIMPAVAIFCLTASYLFLWQYYKSETRDVSLPFHFLLHGSFALWFLIRTDIVPAWFLVSVFLYCRRFRTLKYFLIPLFFFLSIGIPWALFKMKYTGVFSMTTESVGASFMGGLWEVPHKFIWEPSDVAYFDWVGSFGLDYKTKAASDFAMNECLRFCFTYPFYIFSLVWHKFTIFLNIDKMSVPIMFLLIVPFIAILIGYKRMQTLLLGWMIFFNMPIFFVFYSSGGRFYDPAFISLIVVGCSFLFDKEFYARITQYMRPVCFILVLALGVLLFGNSLDQFLIRQDRLRYWAPLLDPTKSSLNIVKSDKVGSII